MRAEDECLTINLPFLFLSERERWEKLKALKGKFRKDLEIALRSNGERETLATEFRSSFNN